MSLYISNIRIGFEDDEAAAVEKAKKKLGIPDRLIERAAVYKKSLDARRRDKISFVLSVVIDLVDKQSETAFAVSDPFVAWKPKVGLTFGQGKEKLNSPIIIAGFGPAGIFAAHTLAVNGYRPIVFERGSDVSRRAQAVEHFWKTGVLDERTNVQFGEGGAGTFSDGKLTTRISDSRCDYVLEQFVRHGAPQDILTIAKPHIGTDKLRSVIASMREEIIACGGEVHFDTAITDVRIENGKLAAVLAEGQEIRTEHLILAVGHSARDTFRTLWEKGVAMEGKNFSVGVRIEQLQSTIDRGLYGSLAGHTALPKGEYQLSYRKGERCVYTFCMCPGGYVVPSSSAFGTVVTNGMSEHARDGKNANSALVVSVGTEDFGAHPLDGMRFQERLETLAFQKGGENYRAPAMDVGSFLKGKRGLQERNVLPSYALGVTGCDFSEIFPSEITDMLRLGLHQFDRKLPGFSSPDGILTGVETRTSSPVRILRGENLISENLPGLYPCGEGACYAGGIVSAAVDGVRVSQMLMEQYQAP